MIRDRNNWSLWHPESDEERAMVAVAERRVQGLGRWADYHRTTLRDLLKSAYLQGAQDVADSLAQKGWSPPNVSNES